MAPDAGVQSGVIGPSTTSVAVAAKVMTAPAAPLASRVMPGRYGQDRPRRVAHRHVEHVVRLVARASVALQETVVSPSGKIAPDAGVQSGAIGPSTTSVAVAANVTTAPAGPIASAVIAAPARSTPAGSCRARRRGRFRSPGCRTHRRRCTTPSYRRSRRARRRPANRTVGCGPSTSSEAETEYETTAPERRSASAINVDGSVSTGAVRSPPSSTTATPLVNRDDDVGKTVAVHVGDIEPARRRRQLIGIDRFERAVAAAEGHQQPARIRHRDRLRARRPRCRRDPCPRSSMTASVRR